MFGGAPVDSVLALLRASRRAAASQEAAGADERHCLGPITLKQCLSLRCCRLLTPWRSHVWWEKGTVSGRESMLFLEMLPSLIKPLCHHTLVWHSTTPKTVRAANVDYAPDEWPQSPQIRLSLVGLRCTSQFMPAVVCILTYTNIY